MKSTCHKQPNLCCHNVSWVSVDEHMLHYHSLLKQYPQTWHDFERGASLSLAFLRILNLAPDSEFVLIK